MKKILLTLVCVLFFAFSAISCKKTCTCKTFLEGELIRTETKVILHERYSVCNDLNDYVEAAQSGKLCTEE